jgi:hypothetical protein
MRELARGEGVLPLIVVLIPRVVMGRRGQVVD